MSLLPLCEPTRDVRAHWNALTIRTCCFLISDQTRVRSDTSHEHNTALCTGIAASTGTPGERGRGNVFTCR